MKELVKLSCVPFAKGYSLCPGAEIDLVIIEREEPESFQISVNSASGLLAAKIVGHRKAPALLIGLTCQKLAEYLMDRDVLPCTSMNHGGADELLSLYDCVRKFKANPTIPFSSILRCSKREAGVFSVELDASRYKLEMITNHIYGESVKTIAEVEHEALIPAQCYELLGRMLGEWLRPESVKSLKFALTDLEKSAT
ncbi:MAG: hypothetical protein AB7V06_08030 [Candidatus Obscuribacterales bacterium]